MQFKLCDRCHKNLGTVYIGQFGIDGKQINKTGGQVLCLKCAKELGINIPEEELDQMMEMQTELLEITEGDIPEMEGKAPPMNFNRIFGQFKQEQPSKNKENAPPKNNKQPKKFIETYCLNISKKAEEGTLDSIVGRDRELARMMQILCRRQKNNPCLIGEPGVGKTAIAEALAQKIAGGKVPYKLKDKEVHLVDMTALVAGTQFRGQFESRMKGLIDEVKSCGNIILVIDEIHSIVGAGDAEGSMNAANILKPALSRGDIQVIGATTLTEYRKYIEKDSALERRFQPIVIEEPSIGDTIDILKGIKHYYQEFHGVNIPDEILSQAVVLSERYITDRFLPDKAIDLLDEASAYLALNSKVINRLNEVRESLKNISTEKDLLETSDSEDRYQKLADLKVKEINELEEFRNLSKEREKINLSVADLAQVIEIWTNVPASNITEHEFVRIDKLDARLKERIIGQDTAVDAVVRAIKRNRAGVAYKRKPVSFIFAGPTGVGKTELVKTLAADLFDSPETLIRLDMSEFMEKHSVSRIIGAPPGYVGYDEAGQLTEKIRRKPYSVILFDEIEKAHPDVLNVLLQILDDGRITDAHGKQVNFENTVIIMTTNAGSNLNINTLGFGISEAEQNTDRTQKALSDFLRPEFINRIDEVITFRALDENDFKGIARIMLGDLKKTLAEKDIAVTVTDPAIDFIAEKSFSRKYGARNMRRFIQTNVEDEIANRVINNYTGHIGVIAIDVKQGEDRLDILCL
ncbi:MAG: ATP-dependent Clp protease ATP-binding subunit [Oscillospiraceae bacterium]|nr:ATP-dependent Clp protease ATP-binding subunit [Oscillospiraceae bacterium]